MTEIIDGMPDGTDTDKAGSISSSWLRTSSSRPARRASSWSARAGC